VRVAESFNASVLRNFDVIPSTTAKLVRIANIKAICSCPINVIRLQVRRFWIRFGHRRSRLTEPLLSAVARLSDVPGDPGWSVAHPRERIEETARLLVTVRAG